MATHETLTFDTTDALAQQLAARVADDLRAGIAQRGAGTLVLAGVPGLLAFFQALRAQELDWSRVSIAPSDECWVAPGDADSREHFLRRHLLRDALLDVRLVSLRTADRNPLQAVTSVIERLSRMARPFDAVVLHAGADGHVAGLLPGTPALDAMLKPDWAVHVAPVTAPQAPQQRITLTLSALLDARRVYLSLPSGEVAERGSAVDALLRQRRTAVSGLNVAS